MQIIREAFIKKKDVLMKDGFADLVTETDQRVEKMVIGFLRDKFPTHRCFTVVIDNWHYLAFLSFGTK